MRSIHFPDFLESLSASLRQQISHASSFLENHYGARCRIVGGAVRDRLLERPVTDVDLEIYGLTPEAFAEAMKQLGAQGVGKSFYVYKYGDLDIALPRKERKVAPGHRGFAVEPAADEREATRRRDFTVNALMYDIREERVLDYWGGLEDLRSRLLRCVDPATFVEDSLRVLRGMQFSARLGFRLEKETCRLCRTIPLDDLPGSRIFGEFEKLFGGRWLHYGLYALESMGVSRRLWGEGLEYGSFFRAAREMAHYPSGAPEALRPYCFLTIYIQHSRVPAERILEAIYAPNRYRRLLEKLPQTPDPLTPAFVADLAKKQGVKESPLACYPEVRTLAQRIGVWESSFEIGVTPAELMRLGFRGRALGEELERRRREKLKDLGTLS